MTKTYQYKVFVKSDNEVQIKNGRKIIDKAERIGDGWYSVCRIWDTLDDALEAIRVSREQFLGMTGADVRVEFLRR